MTLVAELKRRRVPRVALAVAWVFDWTPQGVRRTDADSGGADDATGGPGAPAGVGTGWVGSRTVLATSVLVVLGTGLGVTCPRRSAGCARCCRATRLARRARSCG